MEENKGITAGAMATLSEMVDVIESHEAVVKALPEDQLRQVVAQLKRERNLIKPELRKADKSALGQYRALRLAYLKGQESFIVTLLEIAERSYNRRFLN